jgi:uncharacterized lipoprotein YajG
MRKQLFFATILFLATSCALKPQTVELMPTVIDPSNLQLTEKKVSVHINDSRPMPQVLGIRHKSKTKIPFMKPQEVPYINNDQNLSQNITDISKEYLAGKGFVIASDGKDFEITLEVFQYKSLEKKWYQMPKTKIQLFFTSQVKNENGDVIYNGKHEYLVENTYPIFQPRAKKNQQVLNDALSQGIKRIFMDQNLIEAIRGF